MYRFLTGEPDTVPEFCFNWITVPRVTIETSQPGTRSSGSATTSTASSSAANSTSHFSFLLIIIKPTSFISNTFDVRHTANLQLQPSTSGTQVSRSPSGATTSGTCPATQPVPSASGTQPSRSPSRNLRLLKQVD